MHINSIPIKIKVKKPEDSLSKKDFTEEEKELLRKSAGLIKGEDDLSKN